MHVRALVADTNQDGSANLIDMSQIRRNNGNTVAGTSARLDLNRDGSINLIDMSVARKENGHQATCP